MNKIVKHFLTFLFIFTLIFVSILMIYPIFIKITGSNNQTHMLLGELNNEDYFIFFNKCFWTNMKYSMIVLLALVSLGTFLGIYSSISLEHRGMITKRFKLDIPIMNFLKRIAEWSIKLILILPLPIILMSMVILLEHIGVNPAWRIELDMMILGILLSPKISEILSEKIESLKKVEFFHSARASGMGFFRLYFYHIIYFQLKKDYFHHIIYAWYYSIMYEIFLTKFKFGAQDYSFGIMMRDFFDNFSSLSKISLQDFILLSFLLSLSLIVIIVPKRIMSEKHE